MNQIELENRLVKFATVIIDLAENLPSTYACGHLGKQIIRSGTSSALNYGEARSAESKADFIHKLKIVLKELRESIICLKILGNKKVVPEPVFDEVYQENNELISIFVATVKTLQKP